jgi:hypothetical protein
MPPEDAVDWHEFDYNRKADTPTDYDLVWIVENYYAGGVTVGYFDGFTFRTWSGSDDCSVSHWAPIVYPAGPAATGGDPDA